MSKAAEKPDKPRAARKDNSPAATMLPAMEWTAPPPKPRPAHYGADWHTPVVAQLKADPGRIGAFMVCYSASQAYNRRKLMQRRLGSEAKHFEFEVRETVPGKEWKVWGRYNPPSK